MYFSMVSLTGNCGTHLLFVCDNPAGDISTCHVVEDGIFLQ